MPLRRTWLAGLVCAALPRSTLASFFFSLSAIGVAKPERGRWSPGMQGNYGATNNTGTVLL
jgi:hypothetical protein